MLRTVWPFPDLQIIAVSRQPGADVTWAPGDPPGVLPRAHAVLALWGVTRGSAEAMQANVTLADEAIAIARAIGASRVLHASSAAVYGPASGWLHEDTETAPVAAYGQSKCRMEDHVLAAQGAVDQIVMRIGNVAGADSLFANLREGAEITLDRFADGQGPARSYIAPGDLAQVIRCLCLTASPPRIVNVAAPAPTDMQALVRAAGAGLIWRPAPQTALQRVALDTTRLSALCPLPPHAADAEHLVSDARRSGVWP